MTLSFFKNFKWLYSNKLDFLIIFNFVCSSLFILYYFNTPILVNISFINTLVNLLIALLTILTTILAILYAITDFIKDNLYIKELKRVGLYDQIFDRFIDSIKSIFVCLIIALCVLLVHVDSFSNIIRFLFSIITLTILFFCLLRTYRCFKVFNVLHGLVKKTTITKDLF